MICFSLSEIHYVNKMEILLRNIKINSLEHINPATDPREPSKQTTHPKKFTNQATGPSNTNPTYDPRTLSNPTSHQIASINQTSDPTSPTNPISSNNPIINPTTINGSTTIPSGDIGNEAIILTIKSGSDLSTIAICEIVFPSFFK